MRANPLSKQRFTNPHHHLVDLQREKIIPPKCEPFRLRQWQRGLREVEVVLGSRQTSPLRGIQLRGITADVIPQQMKIITVHSVLTRLSMFLQILSLSWRPVPNRI